MTETPDPYASQPPEQPQPPQPPPPQPPPPPSPGYPQAEPPGYPPQGGYPTPPAGSYPPPGYQAPPPGYQAPPPGYPAPPAYPQAYGAPPGTYPAAAGLPTGMAVAALVVGIIAALGFWVPFGGVLMGLVALVLGIVAWRRASAGTAGGKPMAVIGTILGALAVLGGIIATVLIVWVVGRVAHCTDANLTDEQRQTCIDEEFNVN